jgi:hypothetical protein
VDTLFLTGKMRGFTKRSMSTSISSKMVASGMAMTCQRETTQAIPIFTLLPEPNGA